MLFSQRSYPVVSPSYTCFPSRTSLRSHSKPPMMEPAYLDKYAHGSETKKYKYVYTLLICIYIYIYKNSLYLYLSIFKRLPPLPPTSQKVGCQRFGCDSGHDFWRPWRTRGASCKALLIGRTLGCKGSKSRLFGTPVQAGAPISRPGGGGGSSGSHLLRAPVDPCGGLVTPLL